MYFHFQLNHNAKLEKADILEMTVKHLRQIQKNTAVVSSASKEGT